MSSPTIIHLCQYGAGFQNLCFSIYVFLIKKLPRDQFSCYVQFWGYFYLVCFISQFHHLSVINEIQFHGMTPKRNSVNTTIYVSKSSSTMENFESISINHTLSQLAHYLSNFVYQSFSPTWKPL